ncbi:PLP-dependent transferase [Peribacillus frigoritolerans]
MGIPEGLVRLSCGIEDADDLITELEQVFTHLESNMQVSK